ncbi:Cold shock protein, CspA family [Micromonospora pallida]|uniref:Cold shock protein, CspA family n=1 Tax=Micromonospora pallida TaxID=145854 RepID=A0A1C6STS3_9ACTN|nr:cold shock domain-containing protein [Micromonospora pallida]SCL32653.1 Cold shock protein, CspA family [Micromonospora pallida]
MAEGYVRDFNSEKGYGFITPDAGGPVLLVRFFDIQMLGYKTLEEGERVSYAVEVEADGTPRAVEVTPLGRRMPGRGTSGQSPPSARPILLVMALLAVPTGMMVFTAIAMFGGWQLPEWWAPVLGVGFGASLLVARLYNK